MIQNYIEQINNINNNTDLKYILVNIDYDKISIDEIIDLFEVLYMNKKVLFSQLDNNTIIYILKKFDKKIYKDNDLGKFKHYEILNLLSFDQIKDILSYFMDNNIYNHLIIDFYLTNSRINSIMDLSDYYINTYIDNILSKKIYSKNSLYNYIDIIIGYNEIFRSKLLISLIENEIFDLENNILNNKIQYAKIIYDIHNNIENDKIDNILNDSFINKIEKHDSFLNIIIEYLKNFDNKFTTVFDIDNKLNHNVIKFLEKLQNYIDNDYDENILDTINHIKLKLKSILYNKSLDNFVNYVEILNNYYDFTDNYILVYNDKNIDEETRLDKLSILVLYMLNYISRNSDELENIERFMFKTDYTFSVYLSLLNSVKLKYNIDDLDINDKNRFKLLKCIKNIDRELYDRVVEKAGKELKSKGHLFVIE